METDRKGLKARLRKQWGAYLRRYKPLHIPTTCEFCAFVGEASHHCHNDASPQRHLNVSCCDTCSHWEPNAGLLMFLHWAYWRPILDKERRQAVRVLNRLRRQK